VVAAEPMSCLCRSISQNSPKVTILTKIARRRVRDVDARELKDWEVDPCFGTMAGNHRRERGLPMRRDANASSLDVWERAFCHLRLILNCRSLAEVAGYVDRS
jgi:hypothetical protein